MDIEPQKMHEKSVISRLGVSFVTPQPPALYFYTIILEKISEQNVQPLQKHEKSNVWLNFADSLAEFYRHFLVRIWCPENAKTASSPQDAPRSD